MNSKAKHRFRLQSVLSTFKKAVFITLTTADSCDLSEIRLRWRFFRHDYFRFLGGRMKYVQVYEPHPKGHGWHIHLVVESGFLPVNILRRFSTRAGFGRIHIEKSYNIETMAFYLSKYLAKGIKNSKSLGVDRVRLVNLSRGLSRLCDIDISSDLTNRIKRLMPLNVPCLSGYDSLSRYKFIMAYLLFGVAFHDPIPEFEDVLLV